MPTQIIKFWIKLILFLLPFLVLFSWIEYQARRLPNSYEQKKRSFERLHQSIKILVLGSSHASKDINPALFSCTGFNFSNSSQTLYYDTQLCLKYIDELPRLRGVIIDISYISLYFDLKDSPEKWRDYFYYHYFGIRRPSLNLYDLKAFTYTALYTRGLINDLVFNKLDPKKEFGDFQLTGWERPVQPVDHNVISDSAGLERVKFHNTLIIKENLKDNCGYLEEMLARLQKKNISVCFVSLPVYKTYSKYMDPEINSENRQIILELCNKYKAVYYDFTTDPRFVKEDFSDNDHLNITGAEKVSRLIDQQFISGLCKQ
jgi:hypothetical protein